MRIVFLLTAILIFVPVTGYTQSLSLDKPTFLQKKTSKNVMRHKVIAKPAVEKPVKPVVKTLSKNSSTATQEQQKPKVSNTRDRVLEKYQALAAGVEPIDEDKR